MFSRISLFIFLAAFSGLTEANAQSVFVGDWKVIGANTPPGAILQKLASIRSDRDQNLSELSMTLDDQDQVLGISFQTRTPAVPPVVTADYYFPLTQISSTEGVVLIMSGSYKAVLLKGQVSGNSGEMVVSYLANGLSNSYKTCNVKVERSGREWRLINAYTGNLVSEVMVRTHSFGIRTIEGICP